MPTRRPHASWGPTPVRRTMLRAITLAQLVAVGCLVYMFIGVPYKPAVNPFVSPVALGVPVIILLWAGWRCTRIRRSIADRDVCWECLYPVDAVRPDTERCPECGFPIAESEELFKRWYARRTWVRRLIG